MNTGAEVGAMWKWVSAIVVLGALVGAGVFVGMAAAPDAAAPSPAAARWGKGYVPNVPVIAQDKRRLRFYDDVLKDKIVVLNFVYTACSNFCPLVTARLAQLQERLKGEIGKRIYFVSVSIDPVTDTPEALAAFAGAFPVDPSWLFLTGDFADMLEIRHRLGERTEVLTLHRNDLLLYNDRTSEWQRSSPFEDLGSLALAVRSMDPIERSRIQPTFVQDDGHGVQAAIPGDALFTKLCASCHTVGGGPRVGPDLSGIFKRKSAEWVRRYIQFPDEVRSNDADFAAERKRIYNSVSMPNLNLSVQDVDDIESYLKARDG